MKGCKDDQFIFLQVSLLNFPPTHLEQLEQLHQFYIRFSL